MTSPLTDARHRRRPATDLAVDDRGGDDQESLEDVLPLLIQAENRRCIKDLHDEPRAQQGAYESAASSEQARPSQHDGRDRAQRVILALTWIADTELCKKD